MGEHKRYTKAERESLVLDRAKAAYYKKVGYNKGERPPRKSKVKDTRYAMYHNAKVRAKSKGIPFNLELEDILLPLTCPLLGIDLVRGVGKYTDNSPTLDRIIPCLGYIKGNVQVISMRANRIKDNSTFEEFERMYLSWKLIHVARDDPRCS
jgi:hypothetical protein